MLRSRIIFLEQASCPSLKSLWPGATSGGTRSALTTVPQRDVARGPRIAFPPSRPESYDDDASPPDGRRPSAGGSSNESTAGATHFRDCGQGHSKTEGSFIDKTNLEPLVKITPLFSLVRYVMKN